MSIAFFSDVHANLEALEAFLAATSGCHARYCCGDMVGYGDRPNEVCELLQSLKIPCVAGNHDAFAVGRLRPDPAREVVYRSAWTRAVLSPANCSWLRALPDELEVGEASGTIRIRHASPWDLKSRLEEHSPELSRAMPVDGSTLVIGHTHRSYLVRGSSGCVVNCGSVGLPRSGLPGAQYAVLDLSSGEWRLCNTGYDIGSLQRRLADAGWDPSVIRRLGQP